MKGYPLIHEAQMCAFKKSGFNQTDLTPHLQKNKIKMQGMTTIDHMIYSKFFV